MYSWKESKAFQREKQEKAYPQWPAMDFVVNIVAASVNLMVNELVISELSNKSNCEEPSRRR